MTTRLAYRFAVAAAIAAPLLLVWLSLAVGLLAEEGHPADHMYVGVLGVLAGGAAVARLQPRAMARALVATAAAQALVAVIALLNGMHRNPVTSVAEIFGVNGIFVAMFLGSAWLFQRAAGEHEAPTGAGPAG